MGALSKRDHGTFAVFWYVGAARVQTPSAPAWTYIVFSTAKFCWLLHAAKTRISCSIIVAVNKFLYFIIITTFLREIDTFLSVFQGS